LAVTATTAAIEVPAVMSEAPTVAAGLPQATAAAPTPAVPTVAQTDLTLAAGEVWFSPVETSPPEYELAAPVELRFAGDSGVVGVRADTEMAAAFRRLADELTEGIGNDER